MVTLIGFLSVKDGISDNFLSLMAILTKNIHFLYSFNGFRVTWFAENILITNLKQLKQIIGIVSIQEIQLKYLSLVIHKFLE